MTRPRTLIAAARDSSGAILVFTALVLPAMIGVGGLVVDVGNWLSHKRHLQVQADAGALSGAGRFRVPCDDTIDTAIENEAAKYSSVEYSGSDGYNPGPGFNPQTGGTPPANLHRRINSKTFHDQATPVDGTVREGTPCPAKMIDVKLTETDLPWFLRAAQVKYINAHARVEIRQQSIGGAGALPVGVPEIGLDKVRAFFVDEVGLIRNGTVIRAPGTVVASTYLTRTGTSSDGLALWKNVDAPVSVDVDSARIGVRILLSGADSATPQCGHQLVACYGAGTNDAVVANTPGLSHIRGYPTTPAGTATVPRIRNAQLSTGTCADDGYFVATVTASSCTVGITATIDGLPSTADVFAKRANGANTKVPLTYTAGIWTASSGIPITTGEGAVAINLYHGSGNGTLIEAAAQRAFAGNEALDVSGPIKRLILSDDAFPGISGANSFCDTCGSHALRVTVGLKPTLQNAQTVNDPIVTLKVAATAGGQGASQNQALDCDPDLSNLQNELAAGCGPTYTVNDGQAACPSGSNWRASTPQPWKCVVINTGVALGQVTHGLNERILGQPNSPPCNAPNNWAAFGTAAGLPAGDPRIVQVFLTPFGAFTGTGTNSVPVTGFATFYVTGWDNGGCQGNRAPAGKPDDPAGQGEIVGHYIKYIETLNNGGGGEEFCDFDSLGSCVAVFTR